MTQELILIIVGGFITFFGILTTVFFFKWDIMDEHGYIPVIILILGLVVLGNGVYPYFQTLPSIVETKNE